MARDLKISAFRAAIKGGETDLFFLENKNDFRAAITNYGGRIVAVWSPDSRGEFDNVVAGYDSLSGYLEHDEIYLGAIVGRYANRIKGAHFNLKERKYQLSANDGDNQLHGGFNGFHNAVWTADQTKKNELMLRNHSKDGAEGFPGNLELEVTYTLTDRDELIIEYMASSDKDTIINLTNHVYFNLGGETGSTHARNHQLMINADYYLPVYTDLIPIGELAEVTHTPFDFRKQRSIRDKIGEDHPQLKRGGGYDHNFVLNKKSSNDYSTAARARDLSSGRIVEVKTTEPGMQFFECEFSEQLDLNMDSAFCLETQHFPDSPNQAHFPSTLLKAGEQFYSKTGFIFSTEG